MRSVLVVLILIGALAFFFFGGHEEGNDLPNNDAFARTAESPRESQPVANEVREQPTLVALEADEQGRVELVLGEEEEDRPNTQKARMHLTGRVLDPQGEHVAGMALANQAKSESASAHDAAVLHTDRQGAFDLLTTANLAELSCEDSRWALLFGSIEPSGHNTWRCTLVAAPTEHCTGSVIDGAGRPIAGAEVRAFGRVHLDRFKELTAHSIERRGVTDDQGRFDLGSVPLVAPTKLDVSANDYASSDVELQAGGEHELRIVLTKS